MAHSVPALLLRLGEAQKRISELELELKAARKPSNDMAHSVPALLLRLGEAQKRISELELELKAARKPSVEVVRQVPVHVTKEVYVSDPAKDRMIEALQARLRECQLYSQ